MSIATSLRPIALVVLTTGACASTRGESGAASSVPTASGAAPAAARDVTLAATKGYEMNLRFAGGAELRGSFTSTTPLQWNVHSHSNRGVVIHLQGRGTEGDLRFRTPEDGTYSLMWKNDGDAPAVLHVKIDADARIVESSD